MLLLAKPLPAAAASPKPSFEDRWFVSVEGGYLFNNSASNLGFDPADRFLNPLAPLQPGQNGGTVGLRVGRTVGRLWDVALGYNAAVFRAAQSGAATTLPLNTGGTFNNLTSTASSKLWYQTGDIEFGYRPLGWQAYSVRTFVGARVISAHNTMSYDYNNVSDSVAGTFTKLGSFAHDVDLLGVGPRVGFEASVPLAMAAPLTFDIAGAGAVMFSRSTDHYNFQYLQENFLAAPSSVASSTSTTTSHTVTNLEGRAGLSYHVNSSILTVGYQVQQWNNLIPTVNLANSTGGFQDNGRNNLLVHGPFAKITVELP